MATRSPVWRLRVELASVVPTRRDYRDEGTVTAPFPLTFRYAPERETDWLT